jgi:hypothetical protein
MNNDPNQPEPTSASPFSGLASKIRGGKSATQAEFEATPPKLSITYRKIVMPRGRTWLVSSAIEALLIAIQELLITLAGPIMSPPLRIELDGVVVARVVVGQSFDVITTAGSHRVRILSTFCSATRNLELTNGQRLRFWCLTSISGVVFQRED